jgi:DNA-binding response OmpR family regulator
VKALVVAAREDTRELIGLLVRGIERRAGEPVELIESTNGERAVAAVWRERPDVVVADEIASRMGAFAMARDLRGALEPYRGVIVILLDRPHDAWLARWSGADAWFVKPADPFEVADRIVELLGRRVAQQLSPVAQEEKA